ncbi:hypothetical protein [Nannocystis pusilla]|uniref:hypothetical protein n=1 Tax=Nannocystis pusilla TaxID=889268 RepID=UPI003DA394AC
MPAPRVRTSRPAWLAALAGLALPIGPTAALLTLGPSCDEEDVEDAYVAVARPDAVREAAHADDELWAEPGDVPPEPPSPAAAPGEGPKVAAPEVVTRPLPIGIRGAARTIVVYAAPRHGSDMRGRIDGGSTFSVYELVSGTDCPGEGWARVDHDSYACLKNAVADDREPVLQPLIPEGLLVPFIYAKPKADRQGNLLVEVPRYKSKFAFTQGAEPLEDPGGQSSVRVRRGAPDPRPRQGDARRGRAGRAARRAEVREAERVLRPRADRAPDPGRARGRVGGLPRGGAAAPAEPQSRAGRSARVPPGARREARAAARRRGAVVRDPRPLRPRRVRLRRGRQAAPMGRRPGPRRHPRRRDLGRRSTSASRRWR